MSKSLIGSLFILEKTFQTAKHYADAHTDQIASTRFINISVPCKFTTYYFMAPLIVYHTFRLALLKELISTGIGPNILDNFLSPKNDNSIKHYAWEDIEFINFGKTERGYRVYLGPESINLMPQRTEMRYGQRLIAIS